MESETFLSSLFWSKLLPFWSAFLASALVAYPVWRVLLAVKSRQTVSQFAPEGHQKKQGTPTMGGIIIVIGAVVALVAYSAFLAPPPPGEAIWEKWFGACAILLLGFAAIGFIDDFVVPRLIKGKRGLGWKQKIVMQVVLAVVATSCLTGWHITAQSALYVFLILFASNAYNFLDGLDALAGSVLLALCGGLAVLAATAPMGGEIRIVLTALMGATIPFLFLNAPPAKIFMGDVGSLPIGAILGLVFATLAWPTSGGWTFYTPYSTLAAPSGPTDFNGSMILPLLVIGFVLIAELVPVPMQIFSVKVFKRKIFPYTPIHHAFEKKGWAETRVVWHFLLAQILLAAFAYSILTISSRPESGESGRYHYYYASPGGFP